ncbi:hypothetical protein BB561_003048 [Smittium simulii]|uniref:Condensin complex subunit 1 C-terminal domain-containing protein n=1 Tax=Smittium simulii TaxID=133385 RepID=A0A2T9YN59_9FUNG|nr:hypothetical protein BB561_003048 [Smittium simulii]
MADFGLDWETENELLNSDSFIQDSANPNDTFEISIETNTVPNNDQTIDPQLDLLATSKPLVQPTSSLQSDQSPASNQTSFIGNDSARDFIEPMLEDPSKQQEIKSLEKIEINLTPLEAICMRFNSLFVFQRVWSAKEITQLLSQVEPQKAMDLLIPIAMKLAEDKHLIVKEAMSQNLLPIFSFYYQNLRNVKISNSDPDLNLNDNDLPSLNKDIEVVIDNTEEEYENALEKTDHTLNFCAPTLDEFNNWIKRLLFSSHPTVSRGAQFAAVQVGSELSFIDFHTYIVHSVVLSLERCNISQKPNTSDERVQESVIKSRAQPTSSPDSTLDSTQISTPERYHNSSSGNALSQRIANLFGIIDFNLDKVNTAITGSPGDTAQQSSDYNDSYLNFSNTKLRSMDSGSRSSIFPSSNKDSDESVYQNRSYLYPESVHSKLIMLKLIKMLTEEFGQDLKPAVFVPVVERACIDKFFQVRKEAAIVIGTLCKALSTELNSEIIYPSFIKLASDSNWQVRKSAAVSCLPGLASVMQTYEDRKSYSSDRNDTKVSINNVSNSTSSFSSWPFSSRSWNNNPVKQKSKLSTDERKTSSSDKDTDVIKKSQKKFFSSGSATNNSISERQWIQIIDKFAGSRESSEDVKAAIFECIGQLFISFSNYPKLIDYLITLVQSKVGKASRTWNDDRRSSSGSVNFIADQEVDEDDLLDESFDLNAFAMPSSYSNSKINNELVFGNTRPATSGLWHMKKSELAPGVVSKDILYYCAYNFPAILQAVGPSMWYKLKDTYIALTKIDQYDIRCTLASSLHEIAFILSQDQNSAIEMNEYALIALKMSDSSQILNSKFYNKARANFSLASSINCVDQLSSNQATLDKTAKNHTTHGYSQDLEQVLCLFLLEADEIKVRVLKHLGETMQVFSEKSRMRCLPMILQVFKHDSKLWRTREIMASQLVLLCKLFPANVVVSQLLPISVEWANDPVAGVRESVAPAFSVVFEQTKNYPDLQVIFFQNVISFSHSTSFKGRIFFTQICSALLFTDSISDNNDSLYFDQFFLPSLASLSNDKVPNVRIALARLAKKMLNNKTRRQSISSALSGLNILSSSEIIDQPSNTNIQLSEENIQDYVTNNEEPSLDSKNIINKSKDSALDENLNQNWSQSLFYEKFGKTLIENTRIDGLEELKSHYHIKHSSLPNINFFSELSDTSYVFSAKNTKSLARNKSYESFFNIYNMLPNLPNSSLDTKNEPGSLFIGCHKTVKRNISDKDIENDTKVESKTEKNDVYLDSGYISAPELIINGSNNIAENNSHEDNKIIFNTGLNKKIIKKNTSPMRAHLLLSILQTLLQDKDSDVLEQLAEIPGISIPEIKKGIYKSKKYDLNNCNLKPSNQSSPVATEKIEVSDISLENLISSQVDCLNNETEPVVANSFKSSSPVISQSSLTDIATISQDQSSTEENSENATLDVLKGSHSKDLDDYIDISSGKVVFPCLSQPKLDSKSFRPASSRGFHRRSSSGQLYLDQLPSDISDSLKNMNVLASTTRADLDTQDQHQEPNLKAKSPVSTTKPPHNYKEIYTSVPVIPSPPARAVTNPTFQLKKSKSRY